MSDANENLKKSFQKLTDEELYLAIEIKSEEYTPEAISIAKEVAVQRGGIKHITEKVLRPTKQEQSKEEKPEINQQQLNFLISQIQSKQNLPLGIIGGFVAAGLGSAIWAIITAATEYQIGWVAVGVGFLVGFTIRYLGNGVDNIFGIFGAIFSLMGCLAGNFFTIVYFVSLEEGISFWGITGGA
jgi:hypothetical protein